MNDTSTKIESIYLEKIAQISPEERLSMACQMYQTGRDLVIAGIMAEHPGLSDSELKIHLFKRIYGPDFTPVIQETIIKSISRRV